MISDLHIRLIKMLRAESSAEIYIYEPTRTINPLGDLDYGFIISDGDDALDCNCDKVNITSSRIYIFPCNANAFTSIRWYITGLLGKDCTQDYDDNQRLYYYWE